MAEFEPEAEKKQAKQQAQETGEQELCYGNRHREEYGANKAPKQEQRRNLRRKQIGPSNQSPALGPGNTRGPELY